MVAVAVWLAVLGLVLGSFLNLVIDRAPKGESIVHPRSHCPACGRVLNVLDLVPVAGYLVRGGRCATCGAAIGWRQPALELACAAVLGGAGLLIALQRF